MFPSNRTQFHIKHIKVIKIVSSSLLPQVEFSLSKIP